MSRSQLAIFGILLGILVLGAGIGIGYGIGYAVFLQGCDSSNGSSTDNLSLTDFITGGGSLNCRQCGAKSIKNVEYCPLSNPFRDSFATNPFQTLSYQEMLRIHDFLLSRNIVSSIFLRPRLTDNYVHSMMLLLPPKDEILSYLDEGADTPRRYAQVNVNRGGIANPDIMEYKVGPLDGSAPIQIVPLAYPGELHYNTRPRDKVENTGIHYLLIRQLAPLATLFSESFDGALFPNGGLDWFPMAPPGLRAEERETKFRMCFLIDGTMHGAFLHFLPLTGTVHNPGTDTSRWRVHSLYYANQGPFDTVQDLADAYRYRQIRRVSMPAGYRAGLVDATIPRQGPMPPREGSDTAPPSTYAPGGRRYTIRACTVRWMGWQFTFASHQLRGPAVYDVRFKGERIVYENSLQESALIYAGNSNYEGNAIYMDSTFGMGSFQDLIIGVDCPEHATLVNTTWWDMDHQSPTTTHGLCVFEADGQNPVWRRKDSFAGGLRNNYLVARFAITLGNYEYLLDYNFFLDGKMQTKVTATGFLFGGFWDPQNPYGVGNEDKDPFGYRVAQFTHGPIHDHTFGFKVDLDVLEKENTFQTIHWKAGDVLGAYRTQDPFIREKPKYLLYNETRYIEYEMLEREKGYRLNMERQKFWTVVNENQKNQWNVSRAYRILPMATGTQIMPDKHPAMKALSFSKYHCLVAKRHEDEKYATGTYDLNRLDDPKVSLESILDGELIRNTDIVTWLSVGFLHVPTSEDVPQVTGVETGFYLKPFNFFDNTSVFDMPQWVNFDRNKERPPTATPCVERPINDCYFCNN